MSVRTKAEPALAGPAAVSRNRQIVEGALLADIAVVLLLGRVYLPIPIVRTFWRFLAAAPIILLAQRQGIRIAIMAGIVAYVLLTALVGPTLALSALDSAFAAIIIAAAMKWRWPRSVTCLVGGLIYAVCDIVIPTIGFAILFRVPVSTMVGDLRNGMRGSFHTIRRLADGVNALLVKGLGQGAPQISSRAIQDFGYAATAFVVDHWVVAALIVAGALGILNIFAYQAASEVVLSRLPREGRLEQVAAAA